MKKIVILILILFTFLFSAHTALAAKKSYFFPQVAITDTINADGTVDVVEQRTFNFSGSFTRVYWDIPLQTDQHISNISISSIDENGQQYYYSQLPAPDTSRPARHFAAERTDNVVHIEAYDTLTDVQKTFTLSYKLLGALQKYQDVGQFYWKVIGDGWDAYTNTVRITVILPQDVGKNNIHIWGHGPINGVASILNGKTTELDVPNLDANQFVEVRETFPSQIIQGQAINKNELPTIIAEELQFQKQLEQKKAINIWIFNILVLLLFGWSIWWIVLWFKYGKEYKTAQIPTYITSPPSKLAPALVEALVKQDRIVSGNSFSATILDLARRKILRIDETGTYSKGFLGIGSGTTYTYSLVLLDEQYAHKSTLSAYEKDLLDFIFGYSKDGKLIAVEDLKSAMKGNPYDTRNFFTDWTTKIKNLGSTFVESKSKTLQIMFTTGTLTIYIVLLLQLSFILGNFGNSFLGIFFILFLASIPVIFFVIFIGRFYLRWTKSFEVQAKEWLAFKKYLEDFSDFKNEVPHALIIWEDMLVYGTALGVADKVVSYLPMILKNTHAWPYWYHSSSFSGGNMPSNFNFASSLCNSMSSLNTVFSSTFNTGSGGGFSGGGGGGGGGGGAD